MADEFQVHDITVSEVPVISVAGGITRIKIVRYMVGNHGPFQDEYAPGEYTTEKVKERIDKRVRELRELAAFYPAG